MTNLDDKIFFVDPEYKPRYYQFPVFEARQKGIKRIVLVWHRRAGKDKTCWELGLSEAFKTPGNYWYMFPEYEQGRKAFWESIDGQGKRIISYIPQSLFFTKYIKKGYSEQEMKIHLKTYDNVSGKDPDSYSTIQIVGADKPDSLRGSNPKGVILSEYAEFSKPSVFDAIIEPALLENDGWSLFNFCVTKDTLVFTEKGVKPILNTKPLGQNDKLGYTEYANTFNVYGIGGFNQVSDFYSAGKQETFKVTTSAGYTITGTAKHRLLTKNREWVRIDELKPDTEICISRGQFISSENNQEAFNTYFFNKINDITNQNRVLTSRKAPPLELYPNKNFAYLCGLWLAEGCYSKNVVAITNPESEIVSFLNDTYGFTIGKDGLHHQRSSKLLKTLMQELGLDGTAKTKKLPWMFYELSTDNQLAFLQGYFDGDGTAKLKRESRAVVSCCSASLELIQQIQVVLLNYGITSTITTTTSTAKPENLVQGTSISHILEIAGYSATLFKKHIGFGVQRKQAVLDNATDFEFYGDISNATGTTRRDGEFKKASYRLLKNLPNRTPEQEQELKDLYLYTKVKDITPNGLEDVYDYVVPKTNSFVANGIMSHNTSKGRNAAYNLYKAAQQDPNWYTSNLNILDTAKQTPEGSWIPVISPQQVEEIRKRGTVPEVTIQREYYNNFDAMDDNAYFQTEMNHATERGKISNYHYNPQLPLFTSWDLGVSDHTVVWFIQYNKQNDTLYAIDYYEKTGNGIRQCCQDILKIAEKKGYKFTAHIGPHDIVNRDAGYGVSLYEHAYQEGINFKDEANQIRKADKVSIPERIELGRKLIPHVCFDRLNVDTGIERLRNYTKDFDEKLQMPKKLPKHDINSHGADAFMVFAVWWDRHKKEYQLKLNYDNTNFNPEPEDYLQASGF